MRFAWKVTLASLCILVLSIGMGSHLLISISFRSTLNREIAVAQEEMQMLRIAYEAVCDARGITLENLAQQGKSLQRTLQGDAYFTDHQFRVSTRDGEQVYSTLDAGGDRELLEAIDGLSSGYVLRRADPAGRVLIHCAGPVSLPDGMLYMETLRDITSLFADRETHYQVYRWILLIVVGIGAAVMYALSFWLTRPIRALGRAATALAGGDYAARAQVTLSLEGEPAEVEGVRHVLEEMIGNLVDNGVKYNRPGGSVAVAVGRREGLARLTVRDTGIGIPRPTSSGCSSGSTGWTRATPGRWAARAWACPLSSTRRPTTARPWSWRAGRGRARR